jgi:type III pantothenate kinase
MKEILVIDIGNSNIVIGLMHDGEVDGVVRLDTLAEECEADLVVRLQGALEELGVGERLLQGCVMASVVPALTPMVRHGIRQLTGQKVLTLGDEGVVIDMPLLVDEPGKLGQDRLADAIGGKARYGCPLIIVDMGTATTVNVVDEEGCFAGGMIIPGLKTSFDALTSKAAQLQSVPLTVPPHIVGRNTTECLQSGLLYGFAAMVDGLIARIRPTLKANPTVIITGGLASLVAPLCNEKLIYDEHLLLKGLYCLKQGLSPLTPPSLRERR